MWDALNIHSEERRQLLKNISLSQGQHDEFYRNSPELLYKINAQRICLVDYFDMQNKNRGTTEKDLQLAKKVIDTLITRELSEESANLDEEKDVSVLCQNMARDMDSEACSSTEEHPGGSGIIALKSTGTIPEMDREHQAAVIETKKKEATSYSRTYLTSKDGLKADSNQVNNNGFILSKNILIKKK